MPNKQDSVTLEIYNPDNMRLVFFKDKAKEFRWRIYEKMANGKEKIRYCADEGYSWENCKYNARFFCENFWYVPDNFDIITEDQAEEGY